MRRHRGLLWLAPILLAVLASCGAAAVPRPHASVQRSGTATMALLPGQYPQFIFPLFPFTDFYYNNYDWFQLVLWRPIYWFGDHGRPVFNPAESLASPPVYSDHGRSVTIKIKRWDWSDGRPVTSRDVEFWIDLLSREKANFGPYVPGGFPDNLVRARYPSPTTFTLTFNRAYNHYWLLYNELSLLMPLPQHVWDRTSAAGPIGNYDRSAAGAAAVYRYLMGQARQLARYASNPLWRVVDGAFYVARYDPVTGFTGFRANPRYSGPVRPRLEGFDQVPFTSDAAEFDALRAGTIDYGYVPTADVSQIPYLERSGYTVAVWPSYTTSYAIYNYTNPATGPLFHQLYIRQAIQHLVDQPQWVREILKGYGTLNYGPVPTIGPFASAAEHRNPYPYDPRQAARLLAQHGWTIHPQSADVCSRPGSGPTECGAGIAAGQRLAFTFLYASGVVFLAEEMEALKSAGSQAGIDISLAERANSAITSVDVSCTRGSRCTWEAANYFPQGWFPYGPDYYPTGGEIFHCGDQGAGGYCSRTTDQLIDATHLESGPGALDRYQDYLSRQLPVLWQPNPPIQISAVKHALRGWNPQDPFGLLYPQSWRFAGR